jgi:hypothetical protein
VIHDPTIQAVPNVVLTAWTVVVRLTMLINALRLWKSIPLIGALLLALLYFTIKDESQLFIQWRKVDVQLAAGHSNVTHLAQGLIEEPLEADEVTKPGFPVAIAEDYNQKNSSKADSFQEPAAPTALDEDSGHSIDSSGLNEIFSLSTTDGQYVKIRWGDGVKDLEGYNANLLPHPTEHEQWILVAQQYQNADDFRKGAKVITCSATFVDGDLVCSQPPTALPIAHTPGCESDEFPGPHDPRIFYGPEEAYLLYGSHSAFSCHGMWIQDLRALLPEFNTSSAAIEYFSTPTDLQRPPPYGEIEKNYFPFWDDQNRLYMHHDLAYGRVFSQLAANGSVGPDLGPKIASNDKTCRSKYMPKFGIHNSTGEGLVEYEQIHQTSNSLSITLCKRSDPACIPTNDNTFIMFVFHHKSLYANRAEYFPYIMLFQQTAPFATHAISQKSIRIHGHAAVTAAKTGLPKGFVAMLFITNISWKSRGQNYHGFIDDEIFLSFGIEDTHSGAIDVVVGDLLHDLGYCSD